MEADIAELLASCETEAERQMILERLTPIKTKLEQIQSNVEQKTAVHRKWVEHTEACAAVKDKIHQLKMSLANENLTVDEISQLQSELATAKEQLMELESKQPELASLMADAEVVFKDRTTDRAVDIGADVKQLLVEADKDDAKMKLCARIAELDDRLTNSTGSLSDLRNIYVDEVGSMGNRVQVNKTLMLLSMCLFTLTTFLYFYLI